MTFFRLNFYFYKTEVVRRLLKHEYDIRILYRLISDDWTICFRVMNCAWLTKRHEYSNALFLGGKIVTHFHHESYESAPAVRRETWMWSVLVLNQTRTQEATMRWEIVYNNSEPTRMPQVAKGNGIPKALNYNCWLMHDSSVHQTNASSGQMHYRLLSFGIYFTLIFRYGLAKRRHLDWLQLPPHEWLSQ